MLLNTLNLNSVLIFNEVFLSRNMTLAAKKLAMTQSGVSQHISSLEAGLGISLFIRDKKKIIPTKAAEELYLSSKSYLDELEKKIYSLSGNDSFLSGELVLGVPIEFGNNILFPVLAKLNTQFPKIKFHIRYGLSHEMHELLLSGEIDFAFTDDFQNNPGINHERVYKEELILCCSQRYYQLNSEQGKEKDYFQSLNYVSYLENAPILKEWFKTAKNIKKINLNIVMRTEDAQGVFSFIKHDMGVGVIPKHMLKNEKNAKIHVFDAVNKKVFNTISLSYHEKRITGPFLQFFYQYIKESFSPS